MAAKQPRPADIVNGSRRATEEDRDYMGVTESDMKRGIPEVIQKISQPAMH